MITASKIELAKRCPGAFALPQVRINTPEAEAGVERHEEFEDRIESGDIPYALANRWPDLKWKSEVKFAYDIEADAGRVIGYGTDRDYSSAHALEVCGTADAVGYAPGKLVVVDFKSFDPNVPRADVNPQLHVAALALCRAFGIAGAEVAIHHEVRPFDVAELGEMDLHAFALELRQIMESAAAARAEHRDGKPLVLNTGSWCRWCDSFLSCPAQKQLTTDAGNGLVSVRVEAAIPFVNDDEAADAYELLGRIAMIQQRLRAALYARASERPIPLRSGKMFGPVAKEGNEKLDADIVYDVVRAKHGQAIADSAVKRVATKSQLKSALGFVGAKSVAAAERDVLKLVRERGGSKRETKTVVEEYDAGLRLVAGGDE